ncbi:transglycosylase SLT domain-containing protein [Ideonella margarita]|uniref:Transglycosylase SLT domain-containing protein n=1 Tax=Ideonella margarita TaxID=2984191 RepID=A0ABU9C9H6_9BURK
MTDILRSTFRLGAFALAAATLLSGCASTPLPPMQATSPAGTGAARQVARAPGTQLLLDAAAAPAEAAPVAQPPVLATTTQAVAGSQDETMVTAPIDPLNPDQPVNLDDKTANRDLWVRVRRGFTMSDLDDDYVRRFEQYYATRPDYVKRMTERGGRYLFHVVQEIEKRNMPTELALLPFIESAFNPQAMSTAKASGMWQFIPSTGKDYSLTQNVFRDDRRNVLASTRAALDYLDRLHDMFGDWHLALAAYNWGQGNVQRAITRNQKAGLPTDYASLKMPDETRQYVPKLQAVKNIVMQPDQYKLELPALKNHPYFLSVPIERDIDVDLAAKLAGVSLDEFKSLNPQMNKPVILAAGTEQVLLPYENAASFVEKLRNHRGQLATWTAWVAPKTLRPAEAAKEVGMSEAQLRDVNRIPPKMLVKAGSTLLVPRSATRTADVSEHVADHASIALAPDVPPLKKVTLKAGKKGETVASIAKRYRTTPAQVASWNKVAPNGTFKAGSAIVVFVPNATKVAAARPAPAAAKPAANGKGKATAVAIAKPTVKAAPARTSGAAKTPAPRNRAAIRLADH